MTETQWNPADYDDRAIGPLGLHDAHLLDAICRYVRPRTYLEYGGLLGHSLAVAAPHCGIVVSVDDNAGTALWDKATRAGNARVVKGDMAVYDPVADGLRDVDLVFVDASHLFTDCMAAYERFAPVLSPRALILVHDTGDWPPPGTPLPPQWEAWKHHRAHFLGHDRAFVRALREFGWADVTFGTPDHLRHGITVLSRPTW